MSLSKPSPCLSVLNQFSHAGQQYLGHRNIPEHKVPSLNFCKLVMKSKMNVPPVDHGQGFRFVSDRLLPLSSGHCRRRTCHCLVCHRRPRCQNVRRSSFRNLRAQAESLRDLKPLLGTGIKAAISINQLSNLFS